MNDLKEIGGFIVSADPFVQHDNSLSGNGTVNSPLGVVPGYNETVLFSADTWSATCPLSEPASNFEYINIVYSEAYGNSCGGVVTLNTDTMTFSGGTRDKIYIDVPFYYSNKINCRGGNYSFDNTTAFVLKNGVQMNMDSLTTGSNTITYKGYYTTSANRQASVFIDKIVGINRKV